MQKNFQRKELIRMLVNKSAATVEYTFDIDIEYVRGIQEQKVSVNKYMYYVVEDSSRKNHYNHAATTLEELLQTVHNESYEYDVHPIAVIHQLRKLKKCDVKTDWEHSGYYRFITTPRDIIKFLNADRDDVIRACEAAQPVMINSRERLEHIPNRKEIEYAIRATFIPNRVSPSLLPVLEMAFQGTYLEILLDSYLKDPDFKRLTNLFKEMLLNDDHVSIYYDRNKYALTTFDESAMLFMLIFPTMVYIPQYGKDGLAKCHFDEFDSFDHVDLSKGFVEYSTLNQRQIIINKEPQAVENAKKFAPSIQFFESMLLSEQNELKIYPYDFGTGLERKHMLFNGVPTKQLFRQITDFLLTVPII